MNEEEEEALPPQTKKSSALSNFAPKSLYFPTPFFSIPSNVCEKVGPSLLGLAVYGLSTLVR
jgi:hypothetical protein